MVVGIVIPNEVVPSVVRGKLVGTHNVRCTSFRMEFEVRPIGVVGKSHLAFFLDGIVEHIERNHHLLVVRMCELGQIRDVRHLRMKIAISEGPQLFNEPPCLRRRERP